MAKKFFTLNRANCMQRHVAGGMKAIKNFAELHDAEVFYSMMIERGG